MEKQDIVEKLANSVAWLKQAEDHMDEQTSIGNDFSQVQSQYLAHKVNIFVTYVLYIIVIHIYITLLHIFQVILTTIDYGVTFVY